MTQLAIWAFEVWHPDKQGHGQLFDNQEHEAWVKVNPIKGRVGRPWSNMANPGGCYAPTKAATE